MDFLNPADLCHDDLTRYTSIIFQQEFHYENL